MRAFYRRRAVKEAIFRHSISLLLGEPQRFKSVNAFQNKNENSGSESKRLDKSTKTAAASFNPPACGTSPAPQAFKVRTEGFGPSEDLVKGVLPHSHLYVEASGLHPRDFEVQRRVLELTMPSLTGVTIQPPEVSAGQNAVSSSRISEESVTGGRGGVNDSRGVEEQMGLGLVPVSIGLQGDVQQKLAQQAWEEYMMQVANTIIDQVELKTGVQLEAFRGSQEELQNSGVEVVIQTLKQEMWRVADSLRRVTTEQGEEWKQHAQSMVEEVSRCIYQQLSSQASHTLVESSNVQMSEKFHSSTTLVVDGVSEKVEKYFIALEKRLKDVAAQVKIIHSNSISRPDDIPQVALDSYASGGGISSEGHGKHELLMVENSTLDEQKMEEIHASIVASIEQSAHQQMERVTHMLSSMLRDQQQHAENSTAAAVSAVASAVAAAANASRTAEIAEKKPVNADEEEEREAKKGPDNGALEEFIEGSLRIAADEIRHSVVGEVRQIVSKFVHDRKSEEKEKPPQESESSKKQLELLLSLEAKMDDVIIQTPIKDALNTSMEQLSSYVLEGQTRIHDATESVYTMLQEQEKYLQELQAGIKEVTKAVSKTAAETADISAALAKGTSPPDSTTSSSNNRQSSPSVKDDGTPAMQPDKSDSKIAEEVQILESLLEGRFYQLSTEQNELRKLLESATVMLDAKDMKSEVQLADAIKSISDRISSNLAEMTSSIQTAAAAATPEVTLEAVSKTLKDIFAEQQERLADAGMVREQIEKQNELSSSVQLTHSSIQQLEEGMHAISSQLATYHAKVEQCFSERKSQQVAVTPVTEVSLSPPSPSGVGGPSVEEIRKIVEQVMGFQVEQLASEVHAATVLTAKEVADAVNLRNQEVHEQQLMSLASSLGDMVQTSMAKFREEAIAQHNDLKRLIDEQQQQTRALPIKSSSSDNPITATLDKVEPKVEENSSDSSAPIRGPSEDANNILKMEEQIRSLRENLITLVKEEMGKPLDIDLSVIYKYIDGILLLVREELSQHHSAHEQDFLSLKSSLQEVDEKISSLHQKTSPRDHTELLSALERTIEEKLTSQSTQVSELVQVSKALTDEVKEQQRLSIVEHSSRSGNMDELNERYIGALSSSTEAATAAADAAGSYTAKAVEASLRQVETNILDALPHAIKKEQQEVVEEVRRTVEALQEDTKASLDLLHESLAKRFLPTTAAVEETHSLPKSIQEDLLSEKVSTAVALLEQQKGVNSAEVAALVVEGVQPLLNEERDVLTSAISVAIKKEHQGLEAEVQKLTSKTAEQQVAVLEAIRRVEEGDSNVQNAVRNLTRLVQETDEVRQDPAVVTMQLAALRQLVEETQATQRKDAKLLHQALQTGLATIPRSASTPPTDLEIPTLVNLPQKVEDTLQQIVLQLRQQQQLLREASTAAGTACDTANAAQEAVASSISSSAAQAATYASGVSKRHIETTSKLAEQSAALEALQSSTEEMHEQLAEIITKLSKGAGGRSGDTDDSSSSTVKKMLREVMDRFSDLERQTAKLHESQDFQENQIQSLTDTIRKEVLTAASSSIGKGKQMDRSEKEKSMTAPEIVGEMSIELLQSQLQKTEDALLGSTRDSVREATESLALSTSKTFAEHMDPLRTALSAVEIQLSALEASSETSALASKEASEVFHKEGVVEMTSSLQRISSELEGLKEAIAFTNQEQQKVLQLAVASAAKEAAAAATAAITPFITSPSQENVESNQNSAVHTAEVLQLELSMTKQLNVLKENLLQTHRDNEAKQVVRLTSSWDAFREDMQKSNNRLEEDIKGSLSSTVESISSSQAHVEATIRTTVRNEKEAMEAGVNAQMKQLLASQNDHITSHTSKSLKEESSKWMNALPEAVSAIMEKKVEVQLSDLTDKIILQLQKQQEALTSSSAMTVERVSATPPEQKSVLPIPPPSTDVLKTSSVIAARDVTVVSFGTTAGSALKSIGILSLQIFFLCGTLVLCLYYAFAAFLITFVPYPAAAQNMYFDDLHASRRAPKRVADRVI